MKTVLFACIHNAGRSQMAAAWFDALVDREKARGVSAGTQPGTAVHPEVLVAMREVGIDLANAAPRLLTDELAREASLLVTMGCGETCPVVPGLRREDWPLEDPKDKSVERVREIRDDVRRRVVELLAREGWAAPVAIRAATGSDRTAVESLLGATDLPTDVEGFPEGYVVATEGARVVGVAGIERCEEHALLRSVAVPPTHRGTGIARRLVEDRIIEATRRAARAVHLLTTTAPGFFERLGFSARPRADAPAAVAANPQLTGTRCASAAYLVLDLEKAPAGLALFRFVSKYRAMSHRAERQAERFAALGHPVRLAILRHVVQGDPAGTPAGEIQAKLDIPASTLSHHLEKLSAAGLLVSRREGTFIYYAAAFAVLRSLTDYLWEDCCKGGSAPCC